MLAAERQRDILAQIRKSGSARVDDLASSYNVTRETIRRDLALIESKGMISRSHGGAVLSDLEGMESPFSERQIVNVVEKKAIAQMALDFIQENDSIILDASTTAWQMARRMPDIPLTVLTNSLKAQVELSTRKNVKVMSTGGVLAGRSLSFLGPHAERAFENYHVNKLFMSCSGADAGYGLSDINENQAILKRRMINISDERYLLIDSSKVGKKDMNMIASMSEFKTVVVDDKIDKERLSELEDKVETVHIATVDK